MEAHPDLAGRRIGIVGMARSGIAAARLVARHGGTPFVSDSSDPARLAPALALLREEGIAHEAGGHGERLYASDLIVVSPGVPPTAAPLVRAAADGLTVIGELEMAYRVARCRIVAVTGSNGKTTTTALTAAILQHAGREAIACGNIGLPFSDVADTLPEDAIAVVEASSFQLATTRRFRPGVAVLLNLQPDHLDWHGSLTAYRDAKHRIARNQGPNDAVVYNADDALLQADEIVTAARRLPFSVADREAMAAYVSAGALWIRTDGHARSVLPTGDLRIPGRHNVANACAAALACALCGLSPDEMAPALRAFPGIEHRLEDCGTVGDVRFVNDSKATNVDAVCTAIAAIDAPLHLILGGRDKGAPYTPIAEAGRGRVRSAVVLGEAAAPILRDLAGSFPIARAESLEEAVRRAYGITRPGDVVLLSPACSSFDMFADFEARGRAFKAIVAALRVEHDRGLE